MTWSHLPLGTVELPVVVLEGLVLLDDLGIPASLAYFIALPAILGTTLCALTLLPSLLLLLVLLESPASNPMAQVAAHTHRHLLAGET